MDKPKIVQKSPFVMDMKAGTYAFCKCGESNKQPFCDGSHTSTSFKPIVIKLEEDKKVAWCGCKQTSNGCFCDGTHAKL